MFILIYVKIQRIIICLCQLKIEAATAKSFEGEKLFDSNIEQPPKPALHATGITSIDAQLNIPVAEPSAVSYTENYPLLN